jgi:hypothetical protein
MLITASILSQQPEFRSIKSWQISYSITSFSHLLNSVEIAYSSGKKGLT